MGNLRFLRKAQFEALETYWYLRLAEKTPHIFNLYKKIYVDPFELLKALNISMKGLSYDKTWTPGPVGRASSRSPG